MIEPRTLLTEGDIALLETRCDDPAVLALLEEIRWYRQEHERFGKLFTAITDSAKDGKILMGHLYEYMKDLPIEADHKHDEVLDAFDEIITEAGLA